MISPVGVLNSLFRSSSSVPSTVQEQPAGERYLAVAPAPSRVDVAEGVSTLHVACRTLVQTSPSIIRSLDVVVPLADLPVPATSVVDVAERIAGEYGLVALATLNASTVKVRLARSGESGR